MLKMTNCSHGTVMTCTPNILSLENCIMCKQHFNVSPPGFVINTLESVLMESLMGSIEGEVI